MANKSLPTKIWFDLDVIQHAQTSGGYANDLICKQLHVWPRRRIRRHLTEFEFGLHEAEWFYSTIARQWGIQMSHWPDAGSRWKVRALRHVVKVPIA